MEIWRAIEGYEGVYDVSNMGRVRRVAGGQGARVGIRSLSPDSDGYVPVRLSVHGQARTFKVHALVARAFKGPGPPGQEVNHDNGNRSDNRASNLLYATPGQNMVHAYRILGRPVNRASGERARAAKLSAAEVEKVRARLAKKERQSAIAESLGVSRGTINDIARGKTWVQ